MKNAWRFGALFCGIVIAWQCLSIRAHAAAPDAPTSVKLALNWKPEPEFGGFYAAQHNGDYHKHGLDVQITSGMDHVMQMVAAGQVEYGILAADEVMIARQRGMDLVAVYAVYQTNPQGLMAHASRGFKSIGEILKAPGTLAVQPGLAYVDYLRSKYQPVRATIVPYDFGIARFMVDQNYAQQCFVTAEPIAARQKGSDPQVFLIADAGFNPYAGVVVVRGDYLRSNRQQVREFVAATRDGWRSYLDHPKPANQEMAKLNREMDADTFAAAAEAQKKLIEDDFTKQHGLGAMDQQRWATLGQQLVELKVLRSPPETQDCFTNP